MSRSRARASHVARVERPRAPFSNQTRLREAGMIAPAEHGNATAASLGAGQRYNTVARWFRGCTWRDIASGRVTEG